MSAAALFSLIFATLVGLLPIFLLVGRRVMASRLRRSRGAGGDQDAAGPAQRAGTAETAEAPRATRRITVDATGDPAGRSVVLERGVATRAELYDAARIAGAMPGQSDRNTTLERRLARLTSLQRAVVYREILGPPAGVRGPGGIDAL